MSCKLTLLAGAALGWGSHASAEDPTPTPTSTSERPPPEPAIDKTVNGVQGPITVTAGDSVTYRWVVTNSGERPFHATVVDSLHDALDGECTVSAGSTCEKSAEVILPTPGPITDSAAVVACGIPPWPDHCGQAGYDEDSVTVNVVTPTPTAAAGPDLVVEDIYDAQRDFGQDCTIPAEVRIVVRNIGSLSAGPSTTHLSAASGGSESLATPGLAPGEAATLGAPITRFWETYTGVADWGDVVSETNETNNSLTLDVGFGTFPTCTVTPQPTETSTPQPPTTPDDPPAVGGVAEPPPAAVPAESGALSGESGWSGGTWAALGGIAAGVVAVATGTWYARRRWRAG
jgi:uncharacterized repeat protein (TIGR01451 family)